MTRAELHLHLEGAISRETLRELDPTLTIAEIDQALAYSDFDGFIQSFVWVNKKLRGPADYALSARRLFEDLHRQQIGYAEITISAGVVLWKQQDLAAVFDALANEAAKSPLPIRWILDATRQWGADAAKPVFEFAEEHLADGVVAVGLGGFEDLGPATWFANLFRRAKDQGLHLVCHAGETTGPKAVWDALSIGAERIGHGIRAIEDPQLLAELKRRDIPLEVCISSNVRTGAVASLADHPVRRLFDAGVPITLNTDDPVLFDCSLEGEYAIAANMFGFTPTELAQISGNSLRFVFERQ